MTDPVLTWTLRVLSVARANRFFVIIYFIQHAALVRLSKQIHWMKCYLDNNVGSNLAPLVSQNTLVRVHCPLYNISLKLR